ncbi:MAG TPA: ABC transporter permease [Tepidisphaeraceae bacterium]|jgi:NitT/TauT family transport system permease protein|nr:ABC transporter permease [Tepidisphaeraceae bacterium]
MSILRVVRRVVPPLLTAVVVLCLWAGAKSVFGIEDFKIPSPVAVAHAEMKYWPLLWRATLTTAQGAGAGFLASILVGIFSGAVLSSNRWVERAVYPFTVFLQTVPLVAIAPLIVLWFQPGFYSVAVSAFIVSVFPVIANTLSGMRSIDPPLNDLFQLYGAGPVTRLWKLKLPSALPDIFTGLRIASGLAVIGAIVGEFGAGTFDQQGLGIVVLSAKRNFSTDLVFAAVGMSAVLGLVAFAAVNAVGYLMLRRWHASAREN